MRHEELELLKWLALVSMVIDHAGKTVLPALAEATHFAGRVALPIFGWIVAQRLARGGRLHGQYLRRLAVFGLIAQPAHALIAGGGTANIMFTLGLGVAVDATLVEARAGRRSVLLGGPVALALGVFCEFGPLGVALVPTLAALVRWRPAVADALVGPLGVAANLRGSPSILDLGAFAATPLLWLLRDSPVRIPRLHRWFFYGFYPGHLYLLAGAEVALRGG